MPSNKTLLPALLVLGLAAGAGLAFYVSTGDPLAVAITPDPGKEESPVARVNLPDNRSQAPEFPEGFDWLNTDRPLSFADALKGRVVVLDFWTYCCINCMHMIPTLDAIEKKYQDQPLQVIGVHSAKFDNETETDNIRKAIGRYRIHHPVIKDEDFQIWRSYGVRAWPTLAFVDAEGNLVGVQAGEMPYERLDAIVSTLLEEAREKGVLAETPLRIEATAEFTSDGPLLYPGKVLAHGETGQLFIADSNHDRILVADLAGTVHQVIGSGERGAEDGAFDKAAFNNPQGMAYDAGTNRLYVADTDNHLLRQVDLNRKVVLTLAGTGEQVYDRFGGKKGTAQGLNSPWDVALWGDSLFIAMAGPHQLWRMDLDTGVVENWTGNGGEGIVDGPPRRAELAQPSGLEVHDDFLYFVDSETSALRRASVDTGAVDTLIGTGLFDFGDAVGSFRDTQLQHPLGLTEWDGVLYVADTYNDKIKSIHLDTESTREIPMDDLHQIYEPGGISAAKGILYVADTNNHRVLTFDLAEEAWAVLPIRIEERAETAAAPVRVEEHRVKPMAATVELDLTLPDRTHLNEDYPTRVRFVSGDRSFSDRIRDLALPLKVALPPEVLQSGGTWEVELDFGYCTEEESEVCIPSELRWPVRLEVDPEGKDVVALSGRVEAVELKKSDF